jgi:hypothetical protein
MGEDFRSGVGFRRKERRGTWKIGCGVDNGLEEKGFRRVKKRNV